MLHIYGRYIGELLSCSQTPNIKETAVWLRKTISEPRLAVETYIVSSYVWFVPFMITLLRIL